MTTLIISFYGIDREGGTSNSAGFAVRTENPRLIRDSKNYFEGLSPQGKSNLDCNPGRYDGTFGYVLQQEKDRESVSVAQRLVVGTVLYLPVARSTLEAPPTAVKISLEPGATVDDPTALARLLTVLTQGFEQNFIEGDRQQKNTGFAEMCQKIVADHRHFVSTIACSKIPRHVSHRLNTSAEMSKRYPAALTLHMPRDVWTLDAVRLAMEKTFAQKILEFQNSRSSAPVVLLSAGNADLLRAKIKVRTIGDGNSAQTKPLLPPDVVLFSTVAQWNWPAADPAEDGFCNETPATGFTAAARVTDAPQEPSAPASAGRPDLAPAAGKGGPCGVRARNTLGVGRTKIKRGMAGGTGNAEP